MNTRSRQRQKDLQLSEEKTLNGSISAFSETSTKSALPDGPTKDACLANGGKIPKERVSTPIKRRPGIIRRVPVATWNLIVRKWEIPRKTLHVSIGSDLDAIPRMSRILTFARIFSLVPIYIGISTTRRFANTCVYLYSCLFWRCDTIHFTCIQSVVDFGIGTINARPRKTGMEWSYILPFRCMDSTLILP